MTNRPTPKPNKPIPPSKPVSRNADDNGGDDNKPYKLVSFPDSLPRNAPPAGHDRYRKDLLHGTLFLTLKVQTPLHVSTGVVAMGSDIGSRSTLIKTMTVNVDKKLIIQGSSLKGCIRSVYEAITNSRLGTVSKDRKYPSERLPWEKSKKDDPIGLCPASLVFGASGKNWGWQGLLEFSDAKCQSARYGDGFMPPLHSPHPERREYYDSKGKAAGRKFYYNFATSIDQAQGKKIAVQQASKDFTFATEIHFKNLKPEQLGVLLIILGQDPNYPIALKIGGGKSIGMGTMTVSVDKIEQSSNLRDRYSSYEIPDSAQLTGTKLQEFMQKQISTAQSNLIQKDQLTQLAAILAYPSTKQPPSGMY
jgi:CRISPR/Cas system CSM-associated protein Csm3 (group 7 of RAMP superfamily)